MKTNPLLRLLNWIQDRVSAPDDTPGDRIKKTATIIIATLGGSSAGIGLISVVIIGDSTRSLIFLSATIISFVPIVYVLITGNFKPFVYSFMIATILGPSTIHTSFGGYTEASVLIWPALACLIAAVFLPRKETWVWYGIYVIILVGFYFADPIIHANSPGLPDRFGGFMTVISLVLPIGLTVAAIDFLVSELDQARDRADDLLLNILPGAIAERLKQDQSVIADGYNEVTVLFADIAGFTDMSSGADPVAVVNMLNNLFSEFDELAGKHGLEKIKTIGDAYMVAGGLPDPRNDHTEAVVAFALDMLEAIKNHKGLNGDPITMRVGVNTGPVVAGVIGKQKFIYDLWGDAVNTASRMESNGLVNVVQVTEAVREKLEGQYTFEEREPIHIKGKGEMVTYLLQPSP